MSKLADRKLCTSVGGFGRSRPICSQKDGAKLLTSRELQQQSVECFVGFMPEGLREHAEALMAVMGLLNSVVPGFSFDAAIDHGPPNPLNPPARTHRIVGKAAYMGVFGTQYGKVIPELGKSMIEAEWDAAREAQLPTLAYFLDEDRQPVLSRCVDTGESGHRLRALKKSVGEHCQVSLFTTPDDLASQVLNDVPLMAARLGFTIKSDNIASLTAQLSTIDWLNDTRVSLLRHVSGNSASFPRSDAALRRLLRRLLPVGRPRDEFTSSESFEPDLKGALDQLGLIEEMLATLIDRGLCLLQSTSPQPGTSVRLVNSSATTVVICGSMVHYPAMLTYRDVLGQNDIPAIVPEPIRIQGVYLGDKALYASRRAASVRYLTTIRQEQTYCILVINEPKYGDSNYIGADTFVEIAVAFNARKPIYILNSIPDVYSRELTAWQAVPLNKDITPLIADLSRTGPK